MSAPAPTEGLQPGDGQQEQPQLQPQPQPPTEQQVQVCSQDEPQVELSKQEDEDESKGAHEDADKVDVVLVAELLPAQPPVMRGDDSDVELPPNPPTLQRSQTSIERLRGGLTAASERMKSIRNATVVEEFMCPLCLSNEAVSNGYYMQRCGHQFCHTCIQEFVALQVKEGHVFTVRCPASQRDGRPCSAPVSEGDFHSLLTGEAYEKYTRFCMMQRDNNYRACPKCNHLQRGDIKHPEMVCEQEDCKQQFCFTHSNAHVGKSCDEYARETWAAERENREFVSQFTIQCPNKKCKMPIIKNGGCNHMRCPVCNTTFCFLCRRKISGDTFPTHFAWWNVFGCPGLQMQDQLRGNRPCLMWLYRFFAFLCLAACVLPLLAIALGLCGAAFGLWITFALGCSPILLACYVADVRDSREMAKFFACCFPMLCFHVVGGGWDDD